MPTGPKGQNRPPNLIGNAVRVTRIATGEEADDVHQESQAKRADRASKGDKARAWKLSPKQRKEIAAEAAKARWQTHVAPSEEEDS